MGSINVLDKKVSELIAAGEVIERPASIVKELVENCIDAGSTVIAVEIRNGGISYIRITDNGCGISKEDMPVAFLRHATSKVSNTNDLDSISTLGFRGEALASICAVSKVLLTSKVEQSSKDEEIQGYELDVSRGKLHKVNGGKGTTIVVRDLFYNVPARLKFLKSVRAETMAVNQILDKLAISNPNISIKFIADSKVRFYSSGDGNIVNVVSSVMGKEFADELVPCNYEYNGMSVDGFITSGLFGRTNRAMQHFFINSRYVKSKTCTVALEEAYKSSIMVGKFPGCILNLSLPYNTVDVNVHPAKIEIRFDNEKAIFELIYFAIKSTLSKNKIMPEVIEPFEVVMSVPFDDEQKEQVEFIALDVGEKSDNAVIKNDYSMIQDNVKNEELPLTVHNVEFIKSETNERQVLPIDFKTGEIIDMTSEENMQSVPRYLDIMVEDEAEISHTSAIHDVHTDNNGVNAINESSTKTFQIDELLQEDRINPIQSDEARGVTADIISEENYIDFYLNNDTALHDSIPAKDIEQTPKKSVSGDGIRYVGELFKTYIVVEIGDSVVTIDKHAAHEKIIFNRLKKEMGTQLSRQLLITPIEVFVSKEDILTIEEKGEQINKLGFSVDLSYSDDCKVMIKEVPSVLDNYGVKEIFLDIVNRITDTHISIMPQILEDILHSVACKRAIKSNDISYDMELEELARQVCMSGEVRYCPHGRPVVLVEKRRDFDKKFGRTT